MKSMLLLAASGAIALLGTAAAAQSEPKFCMVMGTKTPWAQDQSCPGDILAEATGAKIERFDTVTDSQGQPVIDPKTQKPQMNKVEIRFDRFASALSQSKIAGTIQNGSNYTLFLPTNEAMEEARELPLDQLLTILLRHVVNEPMTESNFGNSNGAFETLSVEDAEGKMIGGKMVEYNFLGDGQPLVNARTTETSRAHVLRFDLPASNGVVHLVDRLFF